jgi:hypothetical protein
MFDTQLLVRLGLDPGTLHPRVLPRPDPITFERVDRSRIASDHSSGMVTIVNKDMILSEEEEDLADILSPVNDELVLSRSWWFLELLPLKQRHQKEDGTWGWRIRYVCFYALTEPFQKSSLPPLLGPISVTADTSLAAIITKFGFTGRSRFGWKLRNSYFLRDADTYPELSPGRTTAWSGLIERIRFPPPQPLSLYCVP